MNDESQEELHQLLQKNLPFEEDSCVLNSWVIIYETVRPTEEGKIIKESGHMYGPETCTTWDALGLIEWARRFSLRPDNEEGDT